MWSLAGSASIKDRTLTVTIVNTHVAEPRDAEVAVRGATPVNVRAARIAAEDIHTHNTFERPDAVRAADVPVTSPRNGVIVQTFPPASVTRLTIDLG
jgi:alpha-L-arabinofuranosidase